MGPICKLLDSKFLNDGFVVVAHQWASCWSRNLLNKEEVLLLGLCSSLGWSSFVFANNFSAALLLLWDVRMGLTSLHGVLLKASQSRDYLQVDEEILREVFVLGSHKQKDTTVSLIFHICFKRSCFGQSTSSKWKMHFCKSSSEQFSDDPSGRPGFQPRQPRFALVGPFELYLLDKWSRFSRKVCIGQRVG